MRLLVVGGAGKTAARLLPFLLAGDWERIILGDREGEPLCRMAMDFPSAPLGFRFLDAGERDCLRRRIEEADLVVNCAGPLGEKEGDVAVAALEAGRPYLSPGEGEEGWQRVRALEKEAREKGVSLVCGAGVCPGLTGVMAASLARRLDSLEEVDIFLYMGNGDYGRGLVDQLASSLKMRGKRSSPVSFTFPPESRSRYAYPLEHAGSSSLAERLGIPARTWVAFGAGAAGFALFYTLAWSRRESHPFYRWLAEAAAMCLRRGGERGLPTTAAVRLRGLRNGEPREVAAALKGDYYLLSAAALSCAVDMVAAGKVTPGVHPLEQVAGWEDIVPYLRLTGAILYLGESPGERRQPAFEADHA
ncbi:MAG: saccharopine dehydrogenase NADP-binding domain-containing protein [Candidatus Geothermincolales bacterium]